LSSALAFASAFESHFASPTGFLGVAFDFDGVISYQNRGPLFKRDGEFVPGAHQPVWFGEPEVFSPRDTGNSFYTSYTALDGEGILWYGDHKFYLFGKVMDPKD
jgi:hypothetical protein